MAMWLAYNVLIAVAGYLLGAVPTGYLLGKLLKGIDIREHGSRLTGATNVLRTLGPGAAVVALLADVMKGVAAVAFAGWLCSSPSMVAQAPAGLSAESWRPWAMTIGGLLAIIGHSRSVWIRFTGGKSAATGLGVLLAMSWPVGLGAAIVFLALLAGSRIVSLSSMAAAIAAAALMVALRQPVPFVLMTFAGSAYVLLRHRANIARLIAGTEPQLGRSRG